ncbi:MAG: UDP-N-acetylglucosamine 2-epimerase (non-hydrolyzing) [Anaerolineales bacterium]|nr:UDP-N-acetylglucosamine 2-epimerase (non-hydrolyzing) [Anaerolineales bacterium]
MHVLHVVGARPNFMKVAPVLDDLRCYPQVRQTLVHTGQHYDVNMSDVFFQQLGLPAPDFNLEVGSGSHAQQTAQILARFEPVVLEQKPDVVLVYGDVNSTVAAALVCAKLLIPVGHVEAGLRSGDRTMPEEINRLVTDQIADYLFTPSLDGNANLAREGVGAEKIHFVGNVMIDTLIRLLPAAEQSPILDTMRLAPSGYGLVTLHRPSNVDDPEELSALMGALDELAIRLPLVFPVHPRTRHRIGAARIGKSNDQLHLIDPVSYLDFIALQRGARFVITDSGGVQEETTWLGVPCLTLRANTERPVTVTQGTNQLLGRDTGLLKAAVVQILEGRGKQGTIPPLWDGHAGERIAAILVA